jgi:hypothetical protein
MGIPFPFTAIVGPVIIAHRGGSLEAPENTVAAVLHGIGAGADWQEIDVTLSSDGAVVVIDVLRSFTTAAYALACGADEVMAVDSVAAARALRAGDPTALAIGAVGTELTLGQDEVLEALIGIVLTGGLEPRSDLGLLGAVLRLDLNDLVKRVPRFPVPCVRLQHSHRLGVDRHHRPPTEPVHQSRFLLWESVGCASASASLHKQLVCSHFCSGTVEPCCADSRPSQHGRMVPCGVAIQHPLSCLQLLAPTGELYRH